MDRLDPLGRFLAHPDLLDDAGLLGDDRLLVGGARLDGALLESGQVSGAGGAVHWAAVNRDPLLMQAHVRLDRRLDDIGADPHAAALDGALADHQPFLDDLVDRLVLAGCRHRAGCGAAHAAMGTSVVAGPAGLAPLGFLGVQVQGACVLQDVRRAVDLAVVHLGAQQDGAAAHTLRIGVAVLFGQHLALEGCEEALLLVRTRRVVAGIGHAGSRTGLDRRAVQAKLARKRLLGTLGLAAGLEHGRQSACRHRSSPLDVIANSSCKSAWLRARTVRSGVVEADLLRA